MLELYEMPSWLRNQANYPQKIDGLFFPETHMSGLQEATIGNARVMGLWDWLRKDENPFSCIDPPEAHFADEMMTWDLIRYTIKALVELEENLIEDYVWIIENLDALEELKRHMLFDLSRTSLE